ncbi:MAG: hypothetical protein RL264_2231 [Bacteroidota bacterium]
MSSLSSLYFTKEKLQSMLNACDKGVEITIAINDSLSDKGSNVSAYIAQTKEERDNKVPKKYVGNGNTFYTDGLILACPRPKKA